LGSSTKSKSQDKKNHYHSIISEFNLFEGDEVDWYRLNLLFDQVNWNSILEELSPEESLQKFISILEENVFLVFKNHKKVKEETNPCEEKFKSNNKIPKPGKNIFNKEVN
jgi:hypothetical protein